MFNSKIIICDGIWAGTLSTSFPANTEEGITVALCQILGP